MFLCHLQAKPSRNNGRVAKLLKETYLKASAIFNSLNLVWLTNQADVHENIVREPRSGSPIFRRDSSV